MIKKLFSHPYSMVSGIFFGLAGRDLVLCSGKADIFFLALSVTFACLGAISAKRHRKA